MKPLLILLLGVLPCQPLLAQAPNYFGTDGSAGTPTPSPAASVPPELAAARTHYDQEVKQATAPIRVRYARTLDALKKAFGGKGDLAAALAVQQEIERLGVAQNSLFATPGEARVVIWNEHNGGHNNGGAKTLNLVLISDGKEVWRRDGVKIPWQAGTDTKV